MDRQIRNLYFMFLLFVFLVSLIILTQNFISDTFALSLVGILFIAASILGLFTKSIFIGRAIIVPYSSNSKIVKIANLLIGFVGAYLIVFNLYKVFIR